MQTNPFEPPKAELTEAAAAGNSAPAWIAQLLAAFCVLSGVSRMIVGATGAARGGLSLPTVYLICIGPVLWCLLGYLLFRRSKYALAASLAAITIPYFTDPWVYFLVQRGLGFEIYHFDYWNAVSTAVKSITVDAVLYVAVLGYTGWDYRTRFATWRQ